MDLELTIFFKECYSEKEVAEYQAICRNFFSEDPSGIGGRILTDLEMYTFQDTLDLIDADGHEVEIMDDLLKYHRTGKFDHVDVRGAGTLNVLYKEFVAMMRLRLSSCVGLPYVVDMLTEERVEMAHIFNSDVERALNIVREFNFNLIGMELEKKDGTIDHTVMSKFLAFIEQGIKNDVIMFAQSIYYYDLQTDFVFDDLEFQYRRKRYRWRNYLGSEEDLKVEFSPILIIDDNGKGEWNLFPLVSQYLTYDVIVAMKYCSKMNYKMYLYYRRDPQNYLSLTRKIVYDRPSDGEARKGSDQRRGFVRYTGYRFWCEAHKMFNCYHGHFEDNKKYYSAPNVDNDDLNWLLRKINDLNYNDRKELEDLVAGRPFFSVFAVVCIYLRNFFHNPHLDVIINKNKKFIKYGMSLIMINANAVVVDRMSKLFRYNERILLTPMNFYDLRNRGMKMSDRLANKKVVSWMMPTPIVRDMQDIYVVEKTRDYSGEIYGKRGRRRRRGRKGKKTSSSLV